MKSETTVEITGPDGVCIKTTPDVLAGAADFVAISIKINQEIRGQIQDLLTNWSMPIFKAYKANQNELSLGISVNLKGGSQHAVVKTKLSFTASKITDEMDALVQFNQEPLPGMEPEKFQEDEGF